MNAMRRAADRLTSPIIARAAALIRRSGVTRSAGWMRHRGVIVLHAGIFVEEPAVAAVIDFVANEVERRTDRGRAREIIARTIVVMRAGEVIDVNGIDYAQNAVEYPGPVFRRGVVTVAAGSQQWSRALARGLSRLWGSRAGIGG